jgi:hypothetical protein
MTGGVDVLAQACQFLSPRIRRTYTHTIKHVHNVAQHLQQYYRSTGWLLYVQDTFLKCRPTQAKSRCKIPPQCFQTPPPT